jgi:hypothetical protein
MIMPKIVPHYIHPPMRFGLSERPSFRSLFARLISSVMPYDNPDFFTLWQCFALVFALSKGVGSYFYFSTPSLRVSRDFRVISSPFSPF